jgi:hypothetical protein
MMHANASLRSVKHRIETYLKEGNTLDETISPDLIAKKVKIWYEEITAEEEKKKQEEKRKIEARRKKRWDKISDDLKSAPKRKYEPQSLEWQLGIYIGDYIVEKFLPTLSTRGSTHTIIEVTKEEANEYERLDQDWWNAIHPNGQSISNIENGKKEWNHLRAFVKMLEEKYLPKTLECHIPRLSSVSDENMTKLKKGIANALWNSDVSCYSCNLDDIEISTEEDDFFTIVRLKLATEIK